MKTGSCARMLSGIRFRPAAEAAEVTEAEAAVMAEAAEATAEADTADNKRLPAAIAARSASHNNKRAGFAANSFIFYSCYLMKKFCLLCHLIYGNSKL